MARSEAAVTTEATPVSLGEAIAAACLDGETAVLDGLVDGANASDGERATIEPAACRLVEAARAGRRHFGGVDAFMHEYGLTSEEGVVLMCLAEALLRIPDADTADRLIADKIAGGDWQRHLGHSESVFVNASTWGLMLTGRIIDLGRGGKDDLADYAKALVARVGEPVIREAMRHAMRILGQQFVLGQTIGEALKNAAPFERDGNRFSYDMLGEAARTARDAALYYEQYRAALEVVGSGAGAPGAQSDAALYARPGLSVKLSALHPRFEPSHERRVLTELAPRLRELVRLARDSGVAVTVDAEEADRLHLTLKVFANVLADDAMAGWNGLGIAIQAYGKAAMPVLDWLAEQAKAARRRIPVRLVKGAYWDAEIKSAQERGLAQYPVFTRKANTDVSYLACARRLLAEPDCFFPQFATHNAHTIASIMAYAGDGADYEFQRLHGMGRALYQPVTASDGFGKTLRIYAPVGGHEDLLAYLVRRLLENGANTSFVNRIADDDAPVSDIIADPVARVSARTDKAHPHIPLPRELFLPGRLNSRGLPLWHGPVRETLFGEMQARLADPVTAGPIVSGESVIGAEPAEIVSPHDRRVGVGTCCEASGQDIDGALAAASRACHDWDRVGGGARADILDRAAGLLERDMAALMALLVREAGKTLPNALDDVREAVDFLRYYAFQARTLFEGSRDLAGPTGERNLLSLHGRGVFACISPWNFPLAIFTGQVGAALAAGNAVVAKPAEQTPLVAWLAVRLLHEAGVPGEALHLLPGAGETVGAALVRDPRVQGVAFTGSNEVAGAINRTLAERQGAIAALIAETGGINAMIADSTALPEQVTRDVLRSAFDSAGQRCSALRVLCVQKDVAERVIAMLTGATEQLSIGDPLEYATDIGPVIDADAAKALDDHKARMRREQKEVLDLTLPDHCGHGTFVAPAIYEIDEISVLQREVFGPVLHVVRYDGGRLDALCDAINATGYGLTLGIHSRIESNVEFVSQRVRAGNIYVNRNQVGAVVGVQPFGGGGLSGTGPKAGGPHTLQRYAFERAISADLTASGGNAALLSLDPEDTG